MSERLHRLGFPADSIVMNRAPGMNSRIQAVLFDLDGVLVHSPLDPTAIKRELFGDSSVFIIESLAALPEAERSVKSAILLERELQAAAEASLDPAVLSLFEWMEARGLRRGVITRNAREVVNMIMTNLDVDFGVVIAREDAPPKPDPAGILKACAGLGVHPSACVMVGDFTFDIQAGKGAGCRTVFLETDKFRHLEPGADARIQSLSQLMDILRGWLGEQAG